MDKAELLSKFNGQVDLFEKYQTFIDKAQSQSGRFSAAVVERVIADNKAKSMELVGEILPMTSDLDAVITSLEGERDGITQGVADSQLRLEELELRNMIGELDSDAFEAESAEVKTIVETADAKVAAIEEELEGFRAAVARWMELGQRAGMVEPEPEDASEAEADEAEPVLEADEDDGSDGADDSSDSDEAVLDIEIDESAEAAEGDEAEAEFDLGSDDDEDSGFEVGDLDILGDEEELDLEGGDAVVESDQQEKPRRAVLLYQEGTAEEQIYPFSGEVLSLGRGRDNDVQVKNDSKVSRYHCKLYRRGPNFYIEDNKSANGTLVNGELITERRLFGGEEVIIGETFFRFRILD